MQKTDELVNTLVKAVDEIQSKKAKGYDTQATVTRVEGSTAYVHIPGGVDETPAQLTINANKGDTVRVRVAGGTAWLVGNATNPPTDDATANAAAITANTANAMAGEAIESANIAQEAAESAQDSARRAEISANEAKGSAYNASEYASRALGNLSTVQSVAETLTWITQHGTMALTTDVTLDPTHVYFVVDPYGDYTVGGVTYSIVAEPDVADISTYYELSIDESLNNYVGTHLALTSEGLWLLPATSGTYKVLVAVGGAGHTYPTAGTYIIDDTGGTQASFRADGSTIGENLSGYTRTQITSSGMEIIQKVSGTDKSVANFGSTVRVGEAVSGKSRIELDSSGMNVYKDTTDVAFFGDTARIGKTSGTNNNLQLTSTGLVFAKGSSNYAGHINYTSATSTQTSLDVGAGANNINRANVKCEFYPLAKTGEVLITGAYETTATLSVKGMAGGVDSTITGTADKIIMNGNTLGGISGARWSVIPIVNSSGVMEVGRYIDFHISDTGTSDYDARLYANSSQLVSNQALHVNGALTGTLQTPSGSITTTTGTLQSSTIRRFGQVVYVYLAVKNSSAVSAGSNLYVGKWSGAKPVMNATGCAYLSALGFMGVISNTGDIVVRVIGSGSLPANNAIGLSFTFITDE